MTTPAELDLLCINTIRTLSIDAVQKAESGHPGLPLGAAPMAYVLWQKHHKHDPLDPKWADRDRFVLSAGHGSTLLYSLLHLTGYAEFTMDELKHFRQWHSKTPGHPEAFMAKGIEATTGPLGQGHGNAVGMAMAERHLAGRFNKDGHAIVDHFTYCLVGDGDVMEGVSQESASLAGHLKLGKLICLYDSNHVTLDGPASMSFTEDVGQRYEAYGWQVLHVKDGNTDLKAIDEAITAAKADTSRPTMIVVTTTIGFGSPHKAGTSAAHGSPLGAEEVVATKKALGWNYPDTFYVPPEALAHFRLAVTKGEKAKGEWASRFEAYQKAYPELASEFLRTQKGALPADLEKAMPTFPAGKDVETRTAAGTALNAFAKVMPELFGGDADLSGSTKTTLKDGGSFDGQTGQGRNIHFGVREHAMAAISNGMAYHGGVRPFDATFFCFVDYMRPTLRLAAMNHLPVVHVWTHDSIGLGEDGPTHQPVEQLASVRSIPNLFTVRPCDANEASEAWLLALKRTDGPTGLVLSRQKLPVFDRTKFAAAKGLHQGAYVMAEAEGGAAKVILIGTGSELQLAVGAREVLQQAGIPTRVVSMPCMELFKQQSDAYRESVLPKSVSARVSVEAGVTFGWDRWVGEKGIAIGIDTFGASAPDTVLFEKFGFTVAHVVEAAKKTLG